uniref:Uncharacterized protein n=1 Tax=Onchocerca volvulus TaxID=6282 RepID=A0A8R1TJQ7_ONCVO
MLTLNVTNFGDSCVPLSVIFTIFRNIFMSDKANAAEWISQIKLKSSLHYDWFGFLFAIKDSQSDSFIRNCFYLTVVTVSIYI